MKVKMAAVALLAALLVGGCGSLIEDDFELGKPRIIADSTGQTLQVLVIPFEPDRAIPITAYFIGTVPTGTPQYPVMTPIEGALTNITQPGTTGEARFSLGSISSGSRFSVTASGSYKDEGDSETWSYPDGIVVEIPAR